jgi:hypothetical protein
MTSNLTINGVRKLLIYIGIIPQMNGQLFIVIINDPISRNTNIFNMDGTKNSKIKQSTLLDTSIFKMQDDNRAMFGSASLNKNVSRIREREREIQHTLTRL